MDNAVFKNGDDIVKWREKHGVTQEALAYHVGASSATVRNWEKREAFTAKIAAQLATGTEKIMLGMDKGAGFGPGLFAPPEVSGEGAKMSTLARWVEQASKEQLGLAIEVIKLEMDKRG